MGPPAYCPVPDRLTFCGLPGALPFADMEAVRAPVADGVNVTLRVQLPPTGTLAPQLFV